MCGSVAARLTSCRSLQNPEVMRTSSRPSGRSTPRVGTTGAIVVVVKVVIVIP
jgi:hypothetical protein